MLEAECDEARQGQSSRLFEWNVGVTSSSPVAGRACRRLLTGSSAKYLRGGFVPSSDAAGWITAIPGGVERVRGRGGSDPLQTCGSRTSVAKGRV